MDDEELIVHVQNYTFLYDLEDARYSNQLIRENAWEEIGPKMQRQSVECKNRWKALRDCYRKSLKASVTKSGQAAKTCKPWKFEKQMEFLKHSLQYQRDTTSNVNPPTPTPTGGTESVTTEFDEDVIDNQAFSREPTPDESSPASSVSVRTTRKRAPLSQMSSSAAAFQEYMNYKRTKHNKSSDHLSKYFNSLEATVRTFPEYLQIRIKSEFSSILHKLQYETLSIPRDSNQPQTPQYFQHDDIRHSINYNNAIQTSYTSPPSPACLQQPSVSSYHAPHELSCNRQQSLASEYTNL